MCDCENKEEKKPENKILSAGLVLIPLMFVYGVALIEIGSIWK